jgi:hypothetical protein
VRLAYADPPYPGQAKRHYGKNGDPFAGEVGEVDHAALLEQLESFDGWALSTSAAALREVLELCPRPEPSTKNPGRILSGTGVRVAIWYVTNSEPPGNRGTWHWSWEPVIIRPARAPATTIRDVLATHSPKGFYGNTITGQKPDAFCQWVFRLMGAEADDELADLYPGSGAVSQAWQRYASQLTIV